MKNEGLEKFIKICETSYDFAKRKGITVEITATTVEGDMATVTLTDTQACVMSMLKVAAIKEEDKE